MKMVLVTARDFPRHQRGGFTFVEGIVACAITLILFVSFYSAMQQGYVIIRSARENLRATQILVGQMEGIRLYTWNQLTNTTLMPTQFTTSYYPDGLSVNGTNSYGGITYAGTVAVTAATLTNPASSYATNMYQVTVQLSWQSGSVLHTRQMTTYCSRYGVQNYVWSRPN